MAPVIPLALLNLTFINVQLNHILNIPFVKSERLLEAY